jgi:hypothetical protein
MENNKDMRETLAARDGQRAAFTGTFERLGRKSGWKGRTETTVLLKDIRDAAGSPVCDHLWFNLTKEFAALGLSPGDRVQFQARVRPYVKGYKGWREDDDLSPLERDYKLSHPTKIVKLGEADAQMALFE